MIIFDYNQQTGKQNNISIEDDTVQCARKELFHAVFRNFPVLRFEGFRVEECVFENCKQIYFTECDVGECHIEGVDTIYADQTHLTACKLEHLHCDNDCVLVLEDSRIFLCAFSDVELSNGAYLVRCVGEPWLDSCHFDNVRTDRTDRAVFCCEKDVGRFLKKWVQFSLTDEANCIGLPQEEEAKVEDAQTKALRRAVDRGLLTKEKAEALPEYICETEKWDPNVLAQTIDNLVDQVMVYNCLTRAGLWTLAELVKLDVLGIVQIRYINKSVIRSVKELLHNQGITGTAWDDFL